MHGQGRLKLQNGDKCDGLFVNDLFTQGKVTKVINGNEIIQEGKWQYATIGGYKIHGEGREEIVGVHEFEGQFSLGRKKGKGKIRYENGDIFEGKFYNDQMHG